MLNIKIRNYYFEIKYFVQNLQKKNQIKLKLKSKVYIVTIFTQFYNKNKSK